MLETAVSGEKIKFARCGRPPQPEPPVITWDRLKKDVIVTVSDSGLD